VNDGFISFKEQSSCCMDIVDVEIEDLKRDLRIVRDMRMTMAERLINLLGTITELSGSVDLLLIDVEPLRCLPHTGGKGGLDQRLHCDFIVNFQVIYPHHIQGICAEFFFKVPINLITGKPVDTW
jgi:hypothetical protein